MAPAVTCKQCGFQAAIGLQRGQLVSLCPDQARMTRRCRRAEEPGFAYDCPDLTSALLTTLDNEARFPLTPLGLKMTGQQAQRGE
jgi:hypothetical protein